MSDLGPIKFILGAGLLFTLLLIGIGMYANNEGETQRQHVNSIHQQRMDMFNQAMQQAKEAQQMVHQQMQMQAEFMEEAYYGEYGMEGEFQEDQFQSGLYDFNDR